MNENIYKELKKSEEVKAYMEQGNHSLGVLGFTEHSCRHAVKVAETAGKILKKLGYGKREVELAKVAGLRHDVGNCINRSDHAHSGALMAMHILQKYKLPPRDTAVIISAIGQHGLL